MRQALIKRAAPHLGVAAALLLLTLVYLWPMPAHPADNIIGGDGDPLLECWTLCWDVHFLSGNAPSLFDANICHPEKTTLAFADHLFAQALLFFPLYKVTGNQALGYNLLIILTFILNGWGAWLCGRGLGLSRPAALTAGVLFAYFPNRVFEIPHLHILSSQWLPFSFYFLLRFLRPNPGSRRCLVPFTIFSLLCILSSFYQALIWAVLVAVSIIVTLAARGMGWRKFLLLSCSGLVIVLVTVPFARPYFQVSERYGVTRSIEENIFRSARPGDFLSAPRNNLIYGKMTKGPEPDSGAPQRVRPLFPGLLFTLLLICGVAAGSRRPLNREWLILLLAAVAALILSFGPALPWGTGDDRRLLPLPYGLLYHWAPGIQGLRVPARLVLLFHFAGALLAAHGLQRLLSRFRPSRVWAVTLLVCALAFLEGLSLDVALRKVKTSRNMSAAYEELRRMTGDVVLLELPNHRKARQYMPMYTSTFHFHKLANGRSGIIPPVTTDLFRLIDPDEPHGLGPAFLDHALQTGINTILFRRNVNTVKENQRSISRLLALGCLETIARYENRDILYRLDTTRGWQEDLAPLPGDPVEDASAESLELRSRDAFPSSFHRPVKMTAEGHRLHLEERVHFRWLVRIPAGRWQLKMRVTGIDRPAGGQRPVSLLAEVSGVEVIRNMDLQPGQVLEGIPVEVRRAPHYRINCLVQAHPGHRPFDLVLEEARLVPLLATPLQTEGKEIP